MPPEARVAANSPLARIPRGQAQQPGSSELSKRKPGSAWRSCPLRRSPDKGRRRQGECVAAGHESWSQPNLSGRRVCLPASMVTADLESFHAGAGFSCRGLRAPRTTMACPCSIAWGARSGSLSAAAIEPPRNSLRSIATHPSTNRTASPRAGRSSVISIHAYRCSSSRILLMMASPASMFSSACARNP